MSNKTYNASKTLCNRLQVCSKTTNSLKSDKSAKSSSSKKVVTKKPTTSNDGKTCSTGIINSCKKPQIVKPKKTTKSEVCCSRKIILKKSVDFCKNCGGDVFKPPSPKPTSNTKTALEPLTDLATLQNDIYLAEKLDKILEKVKSIPKNLTQNQSSIKIVEKESKTQKVKLNEPVQQYYKNENFRQTSESAYAIESDVKKIAPSLGTIKELPEIPTLVQSQQSSHSKGINICYDSDETEYDSIKQLREFRKNNYFECHSSKSRIESKASATTLNDHKCVYRFYLNDRLFPVPLHSDHHENIRCIECHLPLETQKGQLKNCNNGTIQAKVKFNSGSNPQDMLLMLPVNERLIIKEKRKERKKLDEDVMYFGVIKLSSTGNSLFNQNMPMDSLALKYQKGFQEFDNIKGYKYESIDENDIVII